MHFIKMISDLHKPWLRISGGFRGEEFEFIFAIFLKSGLKI